MNQVNNAFQLVSHWLGELLAVFAGVFGVIEVFCQDLMTRIGVPNNIQGFVLIAVGVLFIIAVLRLFGGVLRLLIVVLLILFLLHIVAPTLGHSAERPSTEAHNRVWCRCEAALIQTPDLRTRRRRGWLQT